MTSVTSRQIMHAGSKEPQPTPSATESAETIRLSALEDFDILDTSKEEIFDRITRLARRVFDVQMSMVTFVDAHRQWFKSCVGHDATETARGASFCNYAVQNARELFIDDALLDERFRDNIFVTAEPFIRFYAGVPLAPNRGPAIGTLCIIDKSPRAFSIEQADMLRDLARMAEMALELRKLATSDSLTGAHTRRSFREEFHKILAQGVRNGHDTSLLVFDIDHFKHVNDTFGHGGGDIALAGVVSVCRHLLRATDFVGRLGGEEFAIALPNTDRAGAMKVAEQLRKAIEASSYLIDGKELRVTASFGVSTLSASLDADGMYSRADTALYAAKEAGRNRSFAASDEAVSDQGQRALKAGLISFNIGTASVECTVRRLSLTGAHLHVPLGVMLPDTFNLRIEADGISRICRIVERKDTIVVVAM